LATPKVIQETLAKEDSPYWAEVPSRGREGSHKTVGALRQGDARRHLCCQGISSYQIQELVE